MSPSEARAALLRLAETEPDEVVALAACLIGHAEMRQGMKWTCGCGFEPRPGEMHARHQAAEVLALLRRRDGARRRTS